MDSSHGLVLSTMIIMGLAVLSKVALFQEAYAANVPECRDGRYSNNNAMCEPNTATQITSRASSLLEETTPMPTGPCRSKQCQDIYDHIVRNGDYTLLNVQLSCLRINKTNCRDLLTYVFSSGERHVLECDASGCRKTGPCHTAACQDYYNAIKERKYTLLNVEATCKNNTCTDTLTVRWDDDTWGQWKCNNNACATTVDQSSPRPSQLTGTKKQPTSTKTEETSTAARTKRSCKLPKDSPRRFCRVGCSRCELQTSGCYIYGGRTIDESDYGGVVRVQCRPGHRLATDANDTVVVCSSNGNWIGEFPECLPQCPPLESDSVIPHCTFNGKEVDCGKPMLPLTRATVLCRPGHSPFQGLESEAVYDRVLRCLYDGKWSAPLPECKPNCGLSKGSSIVEPTIINGVSTPLGVFPWHAGLYQRVDGNYNYICGGSLITKQVVVTAAHCLRVGSYDELGVALGKYYREWDRDESDTVKRNVSDASIPKEFSFAVTTLLWDIALLLLSETVQFNSFIMPVCLSDRQHFINPSEEFNGYVVGWGRTNAVGAKSEYLLHNILPVTLENSCGRLNIAKLVTFDKFCAKKDGGSVVDKGDSGGGLTAIYNHQHYLVGVVSVKYDNVSVFTNVSWTTHVRWRTAEVNNFEDSLSRCPKNGFFCGLTGPCLGGSVRCDGYQQCPDGSDEAGCGVESGGGYGGYGGSVGGGGFGCRFPPQPKNGYYKNFTENYSTNLLFTCNPGYKIDSLSPVVSGCESNGYFRNLSCIPNDKYVCGIPKNITTAGSVNSEFPSWLAAIYIKNYNTSLWDYLCPGTLVNGTTIFTAARCLANPLIKNHPENVRVGLGKFYKDYYTEETDAVLLDISVNETVVPRAYLGAANNYVSDLGVIHLNEEVQFTDTVKSSCFLPKNYTYDFPYKLHRKIGQVATWVRSKERYSEETVLTSSVRHLDYLSCSQKLKPEYQRLLTPDKFCATLENGTSVENLERGAGLTMLNDGRYVLIGIVSEVIDEKEPIVVITDIYNKDQELKVY